MNQRRAQMVAECALEQGRTLYFYKVRNGQWMADQSTEYAGKAKTYTVKEFLNEICGVVTQ